MGNLRLALLFEKNLSVIAPPDLNYVRRYTAHAKPLPEDPTSPQQLSTDPEDLFHHRDGPGDVV